MTRYQVQYCRWVEGFSADQQDWLSARDDASVDYTDEYAVRDYARACDEYFDGHYVHRCAVRPEAPIEPVKTSVSRYIPTVGWTTVTVTIGEAS